MTEFCYLNGKFLPLKDAKISITDIGILRGYGVFDFARTHNGKLTLFNEHFARLTRSAKKLDLALPASKSVLEKIINALIKKNGYAESTVRMVLTGGETVGNGLEYNKSKPTFFVIVGEFVPLPKKFFTNGVRVITTDHQRTYPEAKTNSYIVAVRNQGSRRRAGAFEILYTNSGKVLETTTSNFCMVKNGKILTAKAGVLIGTTRNTVLALAKKKFKVEERDVSVRELAAADEAFLTATNKGVVPITTVDGKRVGNGKVGPVTKWLIEAYNKKMASFH